MTRRRRKFRPIAPVGQRWCSYGQHFAPESDFSGGYCRKHAKEYQLSRNHNRISLDESKNMRLEALKRYGGACKSCGETDVRVLTIFPTDGTGVVRMSRLLKHQKWPACAPDGRPYEIYCLNCRYRLAHDVL